MNSTVSTIEQMAWANWVNTVYFSQLTCGCCHWSHKLIRHMEIDYKRLTWDQSLMEARSKEKYFFCIFFLNIYLLIFSYRVPSVYLFNQSLFWTHAKKCTLFHCCLFYIMASINLEKQWISSKKILFPLRVPVCESLYGRQVVVHAVGLPSPSHRLLS